MLDTILQRLKSKTYWAALAMGLLTVLEANYGLIGSLLPPKYQPWAVALLFPAVMMVLREFTTTALAEK